MAERNTGLPQQKICKKLKGKKIYATYSLKFENLENMKHISLVELLASVPQTLFEKERKYMLPTPSNLKI
jgi:hypothetical protein